MGPVSLWSLARMVLRCFICEEPFGSAADLIKHDKTHNDDEPKDSLKKEKTCKTSNNQEKSISTSCEVCAQNYADSESEYRRLISHRRMHKLSSREKLFKCDQCVKKFTRADTLKTHKITHTGEKRFGCDQCSKEYSHSGELKIHKRTHTGEKPYQCDHCEKAFSNSGDRRIHRRTHTGERPFKCNKCDKAFSDSSTLSKHNKSHTATNSQLISAL